MEIIRINTNFSLNYLVKVDCKTILIDCSCSVEQLRKLTDTIDAIIITHGHFDHFLTLQEVQEYYKCKVYMHEKALDKISNNRLNCSKYFSRLINVSIKKENVEFINENTSEIAGVAVKVFYAFGHTDDSVLIAINNALFVGDFILGNSYGRTDLPTGNFITMQNSLNKFKQIIAQYSVYCGH